jgi:prepilin-type N-terminal cleavage/methylation domain-containing protein
MNRRGFTFIELLVSMVLLGVVSLAVYQLLTNNQRLYRQQAERSDLNATLRGATSILRSCPWSCARSTRPTRPRATSSP